MMTARQLYSIIQDRETDGLRSPRGEFAYEVYYLGKLNEDVITKFIFEDFGIEEYILGVVRSWRWIGGKPSDETLCLLRLAL